MTRIFALIALLAFTAITEAQAPTCVTGVVGAVPTATISFVPPTLNTNGSAIVPPLSYNLYQGATSGSEVKVASGLTASGASISVTTGLAAGTTAYFYLTVTSATGTSSASNEACKTFPAVPPQPDTITITIAQRIQDWFSGREWDEWTAAAGTT